MEQPYGRASVNAPPAPSSRPPPRRRWLRAFLGVALCGLICVSTLLTPTVQTWLLRQVATLQPGWRMEIEQFGVGVGGLDARGLDFGMPGLSATSAPITVTLLPSRLLRGELHVAQVDVPRLRIEITPEKFPAAAPATAPAPPAEPFSGLLPLLRSPLPWLVETTNLDIEIAVKEGGRSVVVSRLRLRGGGLRAGQTGEFAYEFSASSLLLAAGPDNVINSRGTLRITQDDAHGIARIELAGDLALPRYGPVSLAPGKFTLALAATPTGEHYAATLRCGDGVGLDFSGDLDRAHSALAATLAFHVDSSVAAALWPNPPPRAALDGKLTLGLDLKTNALDAVLTGDLTARDLVNLRPELAAVDALAGKLDAALSVRAGRTTLDRATFALRGETSPFALSLTLGAPVSFPLTTAANARITLAGLPAAWANPALGTAAQITTGNLSGEWTLALDPDQTLRLDATRPTTLGPVALTGPLLPGMPPFTLQFSPRLTASAARLAFASDDFAVTSPQGDRVTLTVSATHEIKTDETRFAGTLTGELPTLLASAEHALPFTLGARWDVASTPKGQRVTTLEFTARRPGIAEPAVSLALQQPIDFGADDELAQQRGLDLLKLNIRDLPLAWISRWLPHRQLTGAWAAGESVLRRAETGRGFVFTTRTPWTWTDLGFTAGGQSIFRGRARLAPEFTLGEERSTIRVHQLELVDDAGNRIGGEATFAWREREKKFATTLALDGDFPALPGSRDTFGPLTARLRAEARSLDKRVSQVETFHLEVNRAEGPLFTLASPQPFLFTAKPNGEFIVTAPAPLTVDVARIPLVWLRPWLPPDATLTGILEPTRLLLLAEPQNFRLRATLPVSITDFSYARHGQPQVQQAQGSFFPGVDFRLIHQFQPTFQLGYAGRLHASDGRLDVATARAIDFEGALGFIGNDQRILPDQLDLAARIDFSALHRVPVLAENGMPPAGELVLRANGNLRDDPPEFWARLSGVPSADRRRTLPALEINAHGRIDIAADTIAQSVHFDVATLFATTPLPSDASFQLDVALAHKAIPVTSVLRSKFFDVGEIMALANAFSPPRAPPSSAPAPVTPAPAAVETVVVPPPDPVLPQHRGPLGVPFWGGLRGSFTLELAAVKFHPYRIDGVRGRLALTDRAFTLDDLSGEIFGGRWGGGLRVGYDPVAKNDDHTLAGEFKIEQFDTAHAIRTAFPNDFGSLETRLDLRASVQGAGNRWWQLLDRTSGEFTLDAQGGTARLTHPQLGTASTLLALAGTLSFSSEMRALGRLVRKLGEMPVERLRVSGARDVAGSLVLREFRLDSPQVRLLGHGSVPAVEGIPLVARKLDLNVELAAKDEMAVILGNMKLLEKKPRPDGFLAMKQPFAIGGEVGKPDPSQLYDMLARAVDGSSGTWSLIMRKVQKELEESSPPAPPAKKSAALAP